MKHAFLKNKDFFISNYVYTCVPVCGYVHESAGTCEVQKRALDPSERVVCGCEPPGTGPP